MTSRSTVPNEVRRNAVPSEAMRDAVPNEVRDASLTLGRTK
jgi:ABC-type phosphate transport system permease subunit